MRILAVSDRVLDYLYTPNLDERYKEADLLVGCGDLPFYYLEFLVSVLDRRLVYVLGNHDTSPQYTSDGRTLTKVHGGQDIHGKVAYIKGFLLAGLEGSMRYRHNSPHMYTEREMFWNVVRLVPQLLWNIVKYGRALDILVTHAPPFEIHDGPDIAHQGFKIFRTLMDRFKPRYLLHGHMHVHPNMTPTMTQYQDTMVINVYPSRLIEVEKDKA